jgi:hypothetical protein
LQFVISMENIIRANIPIKNLEIELFFMTQPFNINYYYLISICIEQI